MNATQKKLLLVLGIILAIVLVVLVIFGAGNSNRGKLRIGTVAVPEDSTVTLDGQPSKTGRVYLSPGKHSFKVSREFFTDTTVNVDTKNLKEGDVIYLLPGSDTQEAIDWLNAHPEVQQRRESSGAAKASAQAEATTNRYPITKLLPYNALDYQVDYAIDSKNNISFTVTLFPVATTPGTPEYINQLVAFKNAALDFLKSNKIDTTKTPITFDPDPDK